MDADGVPFPSDSAAVVAMTNELVNKQTNRRLPLGVALHQGLWYSDIVSGTKAGQSERINIAFCTRPGLYCILATAFPLLETGGKLVENWWKVPAGRRRKLMTNKHLSRPGDQKQTGKLKNRIQRNESWENGMGDINILHVLLVHPLPCVPFLRMKKQKVCQAFKTGQWMHFDCIHSGLKACFPYLNFQINFKCV